MKKIIAIAALTLSGSVLATPIAEPHDIDSQNSVGYTHFSVIQSGRFDVAATNTNGHIDPYLFLFRDDGDLTLNDHIRNNDDGGSGLNSLINNIWLNVGGYIAAVSDWTFSRSEAVSGYNRFITPGTIEVSVAGDGRRPGRAVLTNRVPEPNSLALLGLGLVAVGATRFRTKSKKV